jgi:hypothetical protein
MRPARLAGCWLAAVLSCTTAPAWAGDAAAPPKVEPELAPDKDLLARIEALPDNTWMKLPPPKVTGDLSWCGKPDWPNTEYIPKSGPGVPRNYCNKMAWAPDRKRALFCGGNHGAPHCINDVWEYDLAANTWVCLKVPDPQYKGTEEWFKQNVVFKDGVFQTKSGGPVRPAHTWAGLSYDSDKHKLYWLDPLRGMPYVDTKKMLAALGVSDEDAKAKWKPGGQVNAWRNAYIWAFDPYVRKWEVLTDNMPPVGEGAGSEYIPELKQLWAVGPDSFLYDPDKKTLKDLKAVGPGAAYSMVCAYDPDDKVVAAVSSDRTHVYSFASNEWRLAKHNHVGVFGNEATAMFCFDLTAKRFVLFSYSTYLGKKASLWLYDVKEDLWIEPPQQGDYPHNKCCGGYFDPERNVTVCISGNEVFVYRCRNPKYDNLRARIAAPARNAGFEVSAPIPIVATPDQAANRIARVEFYAGANKLGESTAAPFTLTWKDAPPGRHQLTARCFDAAGAVNTSLGTDIRVKPKPRNSPGKGQEEVWLDDELPLGAVPTLAARDDEWSWVAEKPAPHSGKRAHQATTDNYGRRHAFSDAVDELEVKTGDTLFAWVFLDAANPPIEIMLEWRENGNGDGWEHRAYWGANSFHPQVGKDGSASRWCMGALPETGKWIRLEVPADKVGLEGKTVDGMGFRLVGKISGQATWDAAGRIPRE